MHDDIATPPAVIVRKWRDWSLISVRPFTATEAARISRLTKAPYEFAPSDVFDILRSGGCIFASEFCYKLARKDLP